MAWRADIRTPRILATALERLADLSKDPDENDTEKNISRTGAEETPSKTLPSRQGILESGGEVGGTCLDGAPWFRDSTLSCYLVSH